VIARTTALFRFLLAVALASAVLALLPPALAARETTSAVDWNGSLPAPAGEASGIATPAAAEAEARLADSSAAQLPLTTALSLKLHPTLLKQWLSGAGGQMPVLIQLRTQADLNRATIAYAPSAVERRAALVNELQATASRSQAGVLALLDKARQADRASEVRPLWINNSIAARLDRGMLQQVALRDDVAFVQPDRYRQWVADDIDPTSTSQLPASVEWHIQRIRADQVWSALNVSGTGVVVGNMDTGVDWQHPALSRSYRGVNPKGLPDHLYSWFDATNEQTAYPYDGYGHGTHTMGTLAGAAGIGVAPGAKWIAARIFDNQGYAYDSWIHAGFQWILAPGGESNRAPDVLSNSWGSADGADVQFQPDVRLLYAAGIDTYFSNGNAGPALGTVGAPASFLEAFGVGAVDETELIAGFSSRGPSPWGDLKPQAVAPGVAILSSVPGGSYRKASGTSMAAPQVAGVVALMRSAVPGLTITQTRYALTTTAAHAIAANFPNNDYGWGRVDALNSVVSVLHTGSISGVVRRGDTGTPVPYASIRADSRLGTWTSVIADGAGRYVIYGATSLYTVTVSAFGYASGTLWAVPIVTGTITPRDVTLEPLPAGRVSGRVTDAAGTQLLTASLLIQNAPVTITVHGAYSLDLPIGTHVLRAQAGAHRVVTAEVTITTAHPVTQNFALPDAPTILLLDSGRWYNGSVIHYYRQALDDLNYLYDEWPIHDLTADLPATTTLRAYDVVVWSAPLDSPGLIGQGRVISDFLGAGGHLFLSGQDIGYYDDWWYYEPYYRTQLMAELAADAASSRQLTGTHSFAGVTPSISGTGGADNQLTPDVIRSRTPSLTEPAFDYAPAESGGQSVGSCRPYRAVYLPFGFEAINDRPTRAEVLSRTFGILERAPVRNAFALDLTPDRLIAPPGSIATSTLRLTSFDEVSPLAFRLSVQSSWSATLTPTQVSLKSCESRSITITMRIPPETARDASQPITITARSVETPSLAVSTVLRAKAPASVLLVDDDRWYPVDGAYRSALAANGVSYDVWRVPTSWTGFEPAVPSADRLSWYPQVIWFTGYDWYQTLTPYDTQTLQTYLQRGGRLLLSSQEFLSTEGMEDFKHNTLGVMTAATDMTTALVSGVQGGLFDGLVQQSLDYPYPNYDDALAPQRDAQAELVGDHGWPVALAHDMGISKTLYMAFGFEGLPAASQPGAMDRVTGYLSRLGRSSVETDRELAQPGDVITTTIAIMNDGAAPIKRAALTLTLPAGVSYLGGQALTWSGALGVGQIVTRHMLLKLADSLNAGTLIALPVKFRDDDQALGFTRAARVSVAGPFLAVNYAPETPAALAGRTMTWTLTARNSGALTAPVTVTLNAPFDQAWIDGSLHWNTGLLINRGDRLGWIGTLGIGQALTVTYRATAPLTLVPAWLYGSATAATAQAVWQAGGYVQVLPFRAYLPVVRKSA
jgi:uncharacterized repeat protein (TIGR01451 family)